MESGIITLWFNLIKPKPFGALALSFHLRALGSNNGARSRMKAEAAATPVSPFGPNPI